MCDFTCTITSYPLICNPDHNKHRVFLNFTGTPNDSFLVKVSSNPVAIGAGGGWCFPINLNNLGTAQHFLWDFYFTSNNTVYTLTVEHISPNCTFPNVLCTLTPVTFTTHHYGTFFLGNVITPSGCAGSNGIIQAIASGSGSVPANGLYFELWSGNNLVLVQDPPIIYTNTYSFTGVPPGNYTVRLYYQFPPTNPGFPTQSSCYISSQVTVTTKCTLKATDCTTGAVFYFDGAASASLILGLVIRTTFPGFAESCYLITDETAALTTVLGTYYIFDDCDTCIIEPCPTISSTITGIDDVCNRNQGSATVTPTNGVAPFSYLWAPTGQTNPTATGLGSGSYSVLITDVNGCEGTNTIILNNLPCPESFLITPCDPAIAPFYVQDPVTSPDPNPNNYVGNIFGGIITLPSSDESTDGCFSMTPATVPGLTGVLIDVSFYSFNTCLECNPLAYKIARCDDPNIYYFTNTDLSLLVGMVIKNVTLTGCTSATYPCPTLPEQCWTIVEASPGLYPVEVTYNSVIYPDCDCCKPC